MKYEIEHLREAILEIYRWQYANTNSFYNNLILCIQKADEENRFRLRIGFPFLVLAFKIWEASIDQDEFFREWLCEEEAPMAYRA